MNNKKLDTDKLIKIKDVTCNVCADCGSIDFEHKKSDNFREVLTISGESACVEREYDQRMLSGEEEIICLGCESSEVEEVELDNLELYELKNFFEMEDDERLEFLKEREMI